MRIPYTKRKLSDPLTPTVLRPYLDVNLIFGTRSVRTRALLDTGADRTLVNISWAKMLGINLKGGRPFQVYGIANLPTPIFIHTIDIEVINLPKSRRTVDLGFIDSPSVNVLLGQLGFFENVSVRLEYSNRFFDVSIP